MTTVKRVERQIERCEGFRVRVRHPRGRDVRGDRRGMPGYPYMRAAKDAMSVTRWIKTRFTPNFPGFEVEVLDSGDQRVHGRTRLDTVRAHYER